MFAKDLPFMMSFKVRKVGVLSSRLLFTQSLYLESQQMIGQVT